MITLARLPDGGVSDEGTQVRERPLPAVWSAKWGPQAEGVEAHSAGGGASPALVGA